MAYAKYRTCNITGEKGSFWTVEIHKKDFNGASTQINTSGEGFEITWNGQGGTRDRVFLGSECKLNLIVENNTDEAFIYDTISAGNQGYYIRIYKSNDPLVRGDLWWFGWVQPAFDKIQNMPYPYIYQLTSTDSYGYFNKQKEKTFTGNTEKTAPHKLKDIFRDTLLTDMKIFSSTANDSPAPLDEYLLRTVLDWRQTTDSYTEDPADLYYIAKGNVKDETQTDPETGATILTDKPFDYKSQDVFNGLLKAFNAVGFLAEGKYNIIQPNSLKGNITGNIRAWEYNKTTDSSLQVPNILLTIDQNNNNLLAGSTITYEPSFESVKVHYKKGVSIFNVGNQQDLSSLIYAGTLVEQSDAQLQLQFFAKHRETINTADINYPTNQIVHHTFKTTSILTVKATSGTSSRYLVQDTDGLLVWQNTSGTITIERGYNADITNLINSVDGFCDGMPKNVGLDSFSGNSNLSYGPCSTSLTNSNAQQNFNTEIKFTASIPFPDISPADIEIQVASTNDYFKFSSPNTLPLTNPTVQSSSTECEFIQLTAQLTSEQNSPGLTFTASFDGNSASESFDLGDITLGQSINIGADPGNNKMYTFQYLDGTSFKSVNNFQRANPTPDDPTNVTFLLAKEFFELQTEPLEILQGDIQSSSISPLNLIKYSINNDSDFKYYTFLGGTFKAQSEILSGEWFAFSTVNNTITEGTPIPDNPFTPPIGYNLLNTVKNVTSSIFDVHKTALDNNGHGPISTEIASNTSTNKVNISAGVNGSINSGQKLVLTLPDGSNPIILTASSSAAENDVEVDVNSFTTNIIYPVGSVLSPLSYEINSLAKTALGNAAAAQTKADANETNIATNTGAITTNANVIATKANSTTVAANTSSIASNFTAISGNTTNINAVTTKATANETDITSNSNSISSNTSLIATNSNAITTNVTAIGTKAPTASPTFTGTVTIGSNTNVETSISNNSSSIITNGSNILSNTNKADANTTRSTDNQNNITSLTSTVNTKNQTFTGNSEPSAISIGDVWVDTSTTPNTIKRATATGTGNFVVVQEVGNNKTDIAAGSEKLVTGAAIADKISTLSGTPAGSDTQVQFNNNDSFGGTNLLTITDTDEITIGGPSGTNANIKLNAGADIILGADVAGGTSSTIQYLDSGPGTADPTARVMLGAYATDVVVLSNRAADGIVEIRANTSTAGALGELTIATFKDTSVDFLADAELRGTNIGNIFDLTAYLTAVDFTMSTDRSKVGYSRTNGAAVRVDSTTVGLLATFQIPIGYKATHVQVNGSSSSSTFDVYACDVANNTNTSLTSSPSVNTDQILSSAESGVAGKYLSIKFTAGSTTRDVYGAKITLQRL